MTRSTDLRVLFRAAAGPRRGFGHLVRCRSLARALGVRPLIVLRGGRRVIDTALALGCDVIRDRRPAGLVAALRPDVLIVDDPVAADAKRWIAAARRAGCPVASVHDLGIGCLEADLLIDGSVQTPLASGARAPRAAGIVVAGPQFAVLDPSLAAVARKKARATARILISLGGGPRAGLAQAIAEAIVALEPRARVRIAGGFMTPASKARERGIAWVGPMAELRTELARADVAVVGGGVSMYEACALGVAAVGVPVVAGQRPTVAAFAAQGAVLAGARRTVSAGAVARQTVMLIRDPRARRRLARLGRQIVDGRGALRAAHAVGSLVDSRACAGR